MYQIFVLNGSASEQSSNQLLIDHLSEIAEGKLAFKSYRGLKSLPHFDPQVSTADMPIEILELRQQIAEAHGLMICTPEYVFSMPSGLKNVLEWCISCTVLAHKPTALITGSTDGSLTHKQLKLVMKTAMAHFVPRTTVLIRGIRGKFDASGQLADAKTGRQLARLMGDFYELIHHMA